MTSGGALIRILASVGIAVATLYGVFIGGAWSGIHSSTLRSTTLVVALVALGLWGITAILVPAWRPRSRILPALLVPLGVLALTTATSRQPRLGLDYVAWSVILVALYLLLVRLMASPYFRPRMLVLTTFLGLIVGIWYLQEVGSKWIEWWGLVGRITAPPLRPEFASLTFGNPSAVMTMSILLAMPAVAWIGFGSRGRAAASVLLLALAASSTILSGSRAGWVGLALALVVVAGIWLGIGSHPAEVARRIRSTSVRIGLGSSAVIAAGLTVILLPALASRFSAGGEGLRAAYYQAAIRMFADSPIVGTGPGTWVAQRITYTDVPSNDFYIPHAHDVYLQTLAESGLLGGLAGVVVVVLLARLLACAIRSDDRMRVAMGWAATVGLTYFASHQLLDVFANAPSLLMAMAIPIAWLDAADLSEGTRMPVAARSKVEVLRPRWTIGVSILLAISAVAATSWLARSEEIASTEEMAVRAANAGDDASAAGAARVAVQADPDLPSYQVTLGLVASRTGHPSEAAAAFGRAAAIDDLPESWLDLAAVQTELGDEAAALTSLGRALRLGIAQPAVVVGAADLYRQLGDQDNVDRLLTEALVGIPALAGDATFLALEPDSMRQEAAVSAAIARLRGTPGAVEVAMEAGRTAEIETLLADLPPSQREWFAPVTKGWAGDDRAFADLRSLARSTPMDSSVVAWCARLASRRGDTAMAADYQQWFRVIYGNVIVGLFEVRTSRDAPPADSTGSNASFYGHYTYRRPTPWNLVGDRLLRLVSAPGS